MLHGYIISYGFFYFMLITECIILKNYRKIFNITFLHKFT